MINKPLSSFRKVLITIQATLMAVGAKAPTRSITFRGDATLGDVHTALMATLPAHDYHLHLFTDTSTDETYSIHFDSVEEHAGENDAADIYLGNFFDATSLEKEFLYEYDFGVGWEFKICMSAKYHSNVQPWGVTVDGVYAGFPEDCGGVAAYRALAAAARRGKLSKDNKAWLGGDWHPDRFDATEANAALLEIFGTKPGRHRAAAERYNDGTPERTAYLNFSNRAFPILSA